MSDIHTDDKPWNLISDTRLHRCAMPKRRKPKPGDRFECECGTVYQFHEGTLRGWEPQPADSEPTTGVRRARTSAGKLRVR